jgi:hypothetical protein
MPGSKYYNCLIWLFGGSGMFHQVTCSSCGEDGRVLAEDRQDLPSCPRCGGSLVWESPHSDEAEPPRDAVDADILSWLSQPLPLPSPSSQPRASDDLDCPFCGYRGLMPFDSDRGDTLCPACLAVYQMRSLPGQQSVDCPNCEQTFEISDRDRGKTILCPVCHYFLGCLIPAEKHSYRKR